jgi:hypothetical protein
VATNHSLGFGNGSITDNGDGTASYRPTGKLTQAFRVNIADITGFAVRKQGKLLERTFVVLGSGTELAAVSVNHGTSEKIEAWFRAHPPLSGKRASSCSRFAAIDRTYSDHGRRADQTRAAP